MRNLATIPIASRPEIQEREGLIIQNFLHLTSYVLRLLPKPSQLTTQNSQLTQTSKLIPWAKGNLSLQFMVFVCLLM